MDPKMQRYMQRIDQIIRTTRNNASPIRPSRSALKFKTSQLDKYLKYQLSSKIINNFISKHHNQHLISFFNHLKNSQHGQKEVIYKFVAIQKQLKGKSIQVDGYLSCKMVINAIKQVYKTRFMDFISSIRQTNIDSHRRSSINSQNQQKHLKNNIKNTKQTKNTINLSKNTQKQLKKQKQKDEVQNQIKKSNKNPSSIQNFIIKSITKIINQRLLIIYNKTFFAIYEKGSKSLINNLQKQKKQLQVQLKDILTKNKAKQSKYEKNIQKISQQLKNNKTKIQNYQKQSIKLRQIIQLRQKGQQQKILRQNTVKNNYIYNFIQKFWLLNKTIFIKQMVINCKVLNNKKKERRQIKKYYKGFLSLNQWSLNYQYLPFHKIKRFAWFKKELQYKMSIFQKILKNIYKNKLKNYNQIIFNNVKQSRIANMQRQWALVSLQQKDNLRRSSIKVNSQISNIYSNDDNRKTIFFNFVDKIYKLILVISKLLIPLREAFKKIDEYASYQYKIQQAFKNIIKDYYKYCFQQIKTYALQKNIYNLESLKSIKMQYQSPINKLAFKIYEIQQNKIYKLILVISKLLIPLREAFKKIDEYASYQYKLQQSFKKIVNQYFKYFFQQIKTYALQKNRYNLEPLKSIKMQEQSPINKLTFKIYEIQQNKIYKLILVISKLLIPLREAFKKIDEYASYQYKIQQAFKTIINKYFKSSFQQIKIYVIQKKRKHFQPLQQIQMQQSSINKLVLKIYQILSKKIENNCIQFFSVFKIIAKEEDFKIQILPAKNYLLDTHTIPLNQHSQQQQINSAYQQIQK